MLRPPEARPRGYYDALTLPTDPQRSWNTEATQQATPSPEIQPGPCGVVHWWSWFRESVLDGRPPAGCWRSAKGRQVSLSMVGMVSWPGQSDLSASVYLLYLQLGPLVGPTSASTAQKSSWRCRPDSRHLPSAGPWEYFRGSQPVHIEGHRVAAKSPKRGEGLDDGMVLPLSP